MLVGHGHASWGRYKQTAHQPNHSSGSVTITNPIHPLFGQSLSVRKIRRLGATLQISLNHPDGGSFSLPACETSLERNVCPNPSDGKALLAVHQLLALIDWIAVHASNRSPSSIPVHPNSGAEFEDGKDAQPNPHAPSSLPTRRSLRRDKRPTAATDSPCCSFSEQNAGHLDNH